MKIREENFKIPSNRPWGAAPTIAPQDNLCLKSSGTPCQQSAKDQILSVRLWRSAPLIATRSLGHPIISLFFHTSS